MGRSKKSRKCPRCAGTDISLAYKLDDGTNVYVCSDCDFEFEIAGSGGKTDYEDFDFDEDLDREEEEEQEEDW